MSKADRYIAVGGKTFFFNLSESKGGYHYLTIVARRKVGEDYQDEKMTLFPNQIGSFVHVLMETYADLCREMGISNYLYLPPSEKEGVVPEPVEVEEKEGSEAPSAGSEKLDHCPQCGADGTIAFLPDVNLTKSGDLVNVVCVDGCGYKWPEDDRQWATRAEAEQHWDWNWLYRTHKKHNG